MSSPATEHSPGAPAAGAPAPASRPARPRLTRSLRLGCIVGGVVAAAAAILAGQQIAVERRQDLEEITARARTLAHPLSAFIASAMTRPLPEARRLISARLATAAPNVRYAFFSAGGEAVAMTPELRPLSGRLAGLVNTAAATGRRSDDFTTMEGMAIHLVALPTPPDSTLVVAQDMSDVEQRARHRLLQYVSGIVLMAVLTIALVVGVTWFTYERPLRKLADWMRRLRTEGAADAPPSGLPSARLRSESHQLAASYRAARRAGRRLSQAAVHKDQVWTRDRLRAHLIASVGEDHQLVIVSHREPYMHQIRDGHSRVIVPAGGVVTALEPILRACGGVWVAHGAGNGDRESADGSGRLAVPPDDPHYTLRRVWLTRAEEQGYYLGFSNEGLWPLCHLAHERPVFRHSDWMRYISANRRFADAVLDEIGSGKAMVLVQDYQLALVPQLLKTARPDLRVGLFWHIPWPSPDMFRICPWGEQLLAGILSADLVGFHLQQYCNLFLDTVDRTLEARLDWDHSAVELKGHTALVRPFPISVQSWHDRERATEEELTKQVENLRTEHRLDGKYVAAGVGRIDYTKGLPEKFRAVGRFLEKYPQYCRQFVLVELAAPSRSHLRRYHDLQIELETLADEINRKYQSEDWRPIVLLTGHHDSATVHAFLRMADMCIVSSLHDGMNLVAKEYVGAQRPGEGVLVLSGFAGAARELSGALVINPYDTEQFADAICQGIEMDKTELQARMHRMQVKVEQRNVYRWAAKFVTQLAATRSLDPEWAENGSRRNALAG